MIKHIKYSLAALLAIVAFSLLTQCSNGEELIPTDAAKCKPDTCEFKVTKRIKVEAK